MSRLACALLAAVLLLPSTVIAAVQDAAPDADDTCVPYNNAYSDAPLMQVIAAPGARVPLQDKPQTCPARGGCGWRRRAYLTVGDVVLVSAPRGGFRCVYYGAAGGKLVTGFVPTAALKPMTDPPLDPRALVGNWREDGGNTLRVSPASAGLRAEGRARYNENTGQFAGAPKISRGGFTVTDGGCQVTGRRRGPYLKLEDNGACGGMNVSFNGLYMRR